MNVSLSRAVEVAKALDLDVRASRTGTAKIDVLRGGNVIARIGHRDYKDYAQYLELERQGKVPKGYAKERRRLYHIRHAKHIRTEKRNGEYTKAFLASRLLW